MKQNNTPPQLVVGEPIEFSEEHVHTIRSQPDQPGAPALRLNSDKSLVPATEKCGHIIFLAGYAQGKTLCRVTDAHQRFSRAQVV